MVHEAQPIAPAATCSIVPATGAPMPAYRGSNRRIADWRFSIDDCKTEKACVFSSNRQSAIGNPSGLSSEPARQPGGQRRNV